MTFPKTEAVDNPQKCDTLRAPLTAEIENLERRKMKKPEFLEKVKGSYLLKSLLG